MAYVIDRVNLKGREYLIKDSSAATKSELYEKVAEIESHIDSSVSELKSNITNIDASLGRIFGKIAQLDNVMSEEEYEQIENPKNELYFVFEN